MVYFPSLVGNGSSVTAAGGSWQQSRYSHLGIQLAASILLLTYGGVLLDERMGSSPIWTILGLFAGFGVGFYHLYKTIYGIGGSASAAPDDQD